MFKRFNKNIQYTLSLIFLTVLLSVIPFNVSNTCRTVTTSKSKNISIAADDICFYCCFTSNNLLRTQFFINSNDELSIKLSSKKYHILPHGEYEYYQKPASVKNYLEIKHTFNFSDIPVCTSSLLI